MVLDGIRWMAIDILVDILDETGDDLISTVLDALLPVDMDEGHSVSQSVSRSLSLSSMILILIGNSNSWYSIACR